MFNVETIADKYSNIWKSLCDEGLDQLLFIDPVLSFPDVELIDTYQEVFDYHDMMFGMIKVIPLEQVKVKSQVSKQPQRPFYLVYDVDVYSVNDELIFGHKISTNSSNLITRIDVLECNYAEIKEKYSAFNTDKEQLTLNLSQDE